jgi:hypothetical protein
MIDPNALKTCHELVFCCAPEVSLEVGTNGDILQSPQAASPHRGGIE